MATIDLANYITVNVGSYSSPCAHLGDISLAWGYKSTHSYPRHWSEYSGQPYAPNALHPSIFE